MDFILRFVCIIWCFSPVIRISNGSGVADIRLVSYNNLKYEDRNGHCCESYWFTCSARQCDPYFIICLDDLGISEVGKCAQVFGRSKVYTDTDRVTFGSGIGSLENPIRLPFVEWMGFHLKVDIIDEDSSDTHDDIAIMNFSPNIMPDVNGSHVFKYPVILKDGPATMSIEYSVSCDDNYYGSDCTIFCKPDWIHYTCSDTGQRLCFRGWTLPTCLIPSDVCININCQNNASCIPVKSSFVCICQPNYTGRLCEMFIPSTTRLKEILQRTNDIIPAPTKDGNKHYYESSDDFQASVFSTENDVSYSTVIVITEMYLSTSNDILIMSDLSTDGIISTEVRERYSHVVSDGIIDGSALTNQQQSMETDYISTTIFTSTIEQTSQSAIFSTRGFPLPFSTVIYTLNSPEIVSTIKPNSVSTLIYTTQFSEMFYSIKSTWQSTTLSTMSSPGKASPIKSTYQSSAFLNFNSLEVTATIPGTLHSTVNSTMNSTVQPIVKSTMISTMDFSEIQPTLQPTVILTMSSAENNSTIQTKSKSIMIPIINTPEIVSTIKSTLQYTVICTMNSPHTASTITPSLESTAMSSMNFLHTFSKSTVMYTVNLRSIIKPTLHSTFMNSSSSEIDATKKPTLQSTSIYTMNYSDMASIITPTFKSTATAISEMNYREITSARKRTLQSNLIYTTNSAETVSTIKSTIQSVYSNTVSMITPILQSTVISKMHSLEIAPSIKPALPLTAKSTISSPGIVSTNKQIFQSTVISTRNSAEKVTLVKPTLQSTTISKTNPSEMDSSITPTLQSSVISTTNSPEILSSIRPTSRLAYTANSPEKSTVPDKELCNINVNITNNNTLHVQLKSADESLYDAIRRLIKDDFTDIWNVTFGSHSIHIKVPTDHLKHIDEIRLKMKRKICTLRSVSAIQVNENHGLSPGKITTKHNKVLDEKKRKDGVKRKLPITKRKRKNKKLHNNLFTLANETKEGATYQSGIAMGPEGDNININAIPCHLKPPFAIPVELSNEEKPCVVVFDIETTGFGYDAEIVQLAAVAENKEFNKYIIPKKPIHPKATEVTHLYSTGSRLYYKGQQIATEPRDNVFSNFINWLPTRALLVAHNCKRFDSKILVSELQRTNGSQISNFGEKVLGFADTLPLFQAKYPGRKSYAQGTLVSDLLKTSYNAHDAREDVTILRELLTAENIQEGELVHNSFTVSFTVEELKHASNKNCLMMTYNPAIRKKVLSKTLCERAAYSGLSFSHIKLSYERNGVDGIRSIFSELSANGKPRVTKQKSIINRVGDFLSKS